jgi:hypothetical protein
MQALEKEHPLTWPAHHNALLLREPATRSL